VARDLLGHAGNLGAEGRDVALDGVVVDRYLKRALGQWLEVLDGKAERVEERFAGVCIP
jgi:hypothetical protein